MTQTYTQSCNKSNIFIIVTIKNSAKGGFNESKTSKVLKTSKFFEFRRLESKLFHSMTVEGKK